MSLDVLRRLGLDEAEESVFVALRTTSRTFSELADVSGLDPSRLRPALRRLTSLGLVSGTSSRPSIYTSVAPETAVKILHEHEQASLAAARDEALAWLSQPVVEGPGSVGIGATRVLHGEGPISAALQRLIRAAKHDAVALHGAAPVAASTLRLVDDELASMRSGVRWRVVYAKAVLSQPGYLRDAVQPLAAAGQAVRLADDVPTKLLVVDRSAALMPLHPASSDGSPVALVVENPTLADLLSQLFTRIWATAVPLDGPPGTSSQGWAEDLPALLLLGLTDDVIARHIGVNVRTVRRQVASLMAHLGASSRFQAGVQAARRGLV